MKFEKTKIPDVILIEPDVVRDHRGFFFESYHAKKYAEAGIPEEFVQDNHSKSSQGTLRGLHAQLRFPQGKLIRVLAGEIYDVAVDIRKDSPFFGQWVGIELSAESCRQLYVPPGFAHGFCVLSETAEVEYKCTDFYHPEDEIGILWNDPQLGIQWPVKNPILSKKDQTAKSFSEYSDLINV